MKGNQEQFILSLLAYAVQRGVPAKRLCQLSNIDLVALKRKSLEVSEKQLDDVWKNASHLCDDALFGLHFGESLQVAALGAVGEIIKSSETVGDAVSIATTLTGSVTNLFQMEITRSKKSFWVHLSQNARPVDDFVAQQIADLLIMFTIHELDGLVLEKIEPCSVTYPYPVSNKEEYKRALRCAVKKGDGYSIEFKNTYWNEPILTANYELQSQFLQKIRMEFSDTMNSPTSFKEQVLRYIKSNSYLGNPSLQDVASNFNLTTRSLQRRLKEEGISFRQLVDSARTSLATHFLDTGKYQIKEISVMMGYNEMSAFSRAFKRWTGKAPNNYLA